MNNLLFFGIILLLINLLIIVYSDLCKDGCTILCSDCAGNCSNLPTCQSYKGLFASVKKRCAKLGFNCTEDHCGY
ncbi:unnamed protein product [Meloidogyne enterolobii]|uniref:Uncharacterized protein n=1 Tax=Meloidogyne enterolobii TaxID=390850 RepID=A0ACB0XUB4_MELEN